MTRSLPTITAETILARRPCWIDDDEPPTAAERLAALNARYRRTDWTALEILSLDEVSAKDRLWAVLHDSALPPAVLRRFAVQVSASAMRATGWTDARSWAALDAALAYERGEVGQAAESAAESAAWSAAYSAARSAADSAARSAAYSAAWSAADSAARSAAYSAAWSAAWSAAYSAARSVQLCPLRQITLRWLDGEDVLAGGVWPAKAAVAA